MNKGRKTRLNKTQGTKTEFVGFGAFADATTTPLQQHSTNDSTKDNNKAPSQNTLRWSPIYAGKDSHLASLVFPRLIKRDATTKVKALQELQEYFQNDSLPKKQQVEALAHYVFLYYSKLSYDSASAVRAESLLVLTLAASRVPKAFQTLVQQNRQILGMMYCCHGDPAAEVRAVAKKHLKDELIQNDESSYSQEDLEAGMWEYVERILSYGRAKNMHEDLFATSLKSSNSGGGSGGKKGASDNATSSEDLNDAQRDQLEERFERIVGTALSGMQIWIQNHGITEINNVAGHDVTNSAFLWKTLSSPKVSLRRKTYQLLGVCCQKAALIIFGRDQNDNPGNFAKSLPQALAAEKEPGNITPLLEALLGYLAAFSKYRNEDDNPWDFMNAPTVTKHLVKIFKKSCYGASASQWGPTLLPLLAMLPSLEDQIAVLSAAWKGTEQAVRLGDQLVVAATVSESASYFLLRKGPQEESLPEGEDKEEGSDAKILAQLWIDALKSFLETQISSKATSGPVSQAQQALWKGLGRELHHFDQACRDRPNCAIYTVKRWFWDELKSCIFESDGYTPLAKIVEEVCRIKASSQEAGSFSKDSYLSLILREKFHKVLADFQKTSGAVPSSDAYEIMIRIIKHDGLGVLSSASPEEETSRETSVEKFLMNDVLRWMIIHTSTLSTQKQTTTLVENDFSLYGICAVELPSEKQAQIWNSLLREVISAKCDLNLLVSGLRVLLRQDKITVDQLQCDLLDKFAVDVVKEAIEKHEKDVQVEGHYPEGDEDHETLKGFLSACGGLYPGVPPLVRIDAMSKWIDLACSDSDSDAMIPSALLEALLALSQQSAMMGASETQRVVLQSWKQGGTVWDEAAVKVLLQKDALCKTMLNEGATYLKQILQDYSTALIQSNATSVAKSWSEKAWRLLELSRQAIAATNTEGTTLSKPSLAIVNITDLSIWESSEHHDFLFACLMYLLRHIEDPRERLQFLEQSAEVEANKLVVQLLLQLSEASSDVVNAARAMKRKDRCAQLLAALGGSNVGDARIAEWVRCVVSLLDKYIAEQDYARIRKSVALVSQLVGLMFDQVKPRDVFNANDDDDEELGNEFRREKVARVIVPIVKEQAFSSLPWDSSFAELANILISQCGLGQERGIGSLHYDIFQLILGADRRLHRYLDPDSTSDDEAISQEVWLLSLSCGFGFNTPVSIWNSQLLMFDADKITQLLLDYADKMESLDAESSLRRAILAWLITAGSALKNEEVRIRALTAIYKGSLALMDSNVFDEGVFMALRFLYSAMAVIQKNKVDLAEGLEAQVMMKMTKAFICDWESNAPQSETTTIDFDGACVPQSKLQPAWRSLSYFSDIISFAMANDTGALVSAAQGYVDDLVKTLFVESKRWFAFRLLCAIAAAAEACNDPTPEESTAHRLKEWTKDLEGEEKEELEEDVEIVCETLPHKLMTEMESWAEEEVSETIDDNIIVGRAMIWLVCLRFIDASVQIDAANRPSFCSYIEKCEAVESILNLTILHTGIGTDRNKQREELVEMDDLLVHEEKIDSSTLASVVLFRTVEALPSLSRRWWEDDCPRVYTSLIRDYIEARVAPVILRSELERIKLASIQNSFGSMSVSGSVTTREIIATYVQDEIKLKVQIKLPSCFPFRSAEVDCSQTLGVPQKRWKLWSLQITQMLNNQGGTLHEALMLWKENVDKEFEGVEPCPVCYSVLHVKNHKLPELECTTCSNRFHVSCLTQWFKSSGKTQCVICQQPWVGTRVKK